METETALSEAQIACSKAYVPYSNFSVGAALIGKSGAVYRGSNIENISYGLTMCAERVSVGTALQNGEREFDLLALVSDSNEPVVPCGACRQVLAEFAPNLRIVARGRGGVVSEYNLSDLLPRPRQGILG